MRKKTKALLTVLACAAALLAATYFAGRHYFSGHFYPGTTIDGYDVGRLTDREARKTLTAGAGSYSLTITGKNLEAALVPDDIGFAYGSLEEVSGALGSQKPGLWFARLSGGYAYSIGASYDGDMFRDCLEALLCEGRTYPEDARIEYSESRYVIVPETEGDAVDLEEAGEAISLAVLEGEPSVDISGCVLEASVKADDPGLEADLEQLGTIMSSDITYRDGNCTLSLDKETIHGFIIYEGEGVSLDEDAIFDFVTESVCPVFNTLGTTRTLTTPLSGTFEVSGGTYGYDVWRRPEAEKLAEELMEGAAAERAPVYYAEEAGRGEDDDIGDTYIDANIALQKVSLVIEGEEALRTDMVSGNVSTGADTPTGVYRIEAKATDYTMVKYDTFVNYWLPIDYETGVGLHDATWRSSFGGEIYKTNGSHGCLNLPYDAAEEMYGLVETGMPVIVH